MQPPGGGRSGSPSGWRRTTGPGSLSGLRPRRAGARPRTGARDRQAQRRKAAAKAPACCGSPTAAAGSGRDSSQRAKRSRAWLRWHVRVDQVSVPDSSRTLRCHLIAFLAHGIRASPGEQPTDRQGSRGAQGNARVAPRMPGVQFPPGPVVEAGRQGQPRIAEQAPQPDTAPVVLGGQAAVPGMEPHAVECAAGPACPPRPAIAAAAGRTQRPRPASRPAGCRHRQTPSARRGAASAPSTRSRAASARGAPEAGSGGPGRLRRSFPSLRSRGRSPRRATREAGRPVAGPPDRSHLQGQAAAGPCRHHPSWPARHPDVYVFQFAAAFRASSSRTQP